jgi:hypothetical protein
MLFIATGRPFEHVFDSELQSVTARRNIIIMASIQDNNSSDSDFEGFSSPVRSSALIAADIDDNLSVSSVHTSDLSDFDFDLTDFDEDDAPV